MTQEKAPFTLAAGFRGARKWRHDSDKFENRYLPHSSMADGVAAFMTCSASAALLVVPSLAMSAWIRGRMLSILNDPIHFRAVLRKDGTGSVYASYNQILGTRLVCDLTPEEIVTLLAAAESEELVEFGAQTDCAPVEDAATDVEVAVPDLMSVRCYLDDLKERASRWDKYKREGPSIAQEVRTVVARMERALGFKEE